MKLMVNAIVAGIVLMTGITAANAGVVVGGTRVIYDGGKKESSLSVNNTDSSPYLIQSWIDSENGGAEKAPFIITPPLFRLDKDQSNVLRIVKTGNMPEDKESLYWLNVKSIPSGAAQNNTLQVAVKTRIKLIYRPKSLKNFDIEKEAQSIKWKSTPNGIQVTNPGKFYINFNEISLNGKKIEAPTYVSSQQTVLFPTKGAASSGQVTFKVINDFGGVSQQFKTSY